MRNVKMIAVVLCLVASILLGLGEGQQTKMVDQKLTQLGGWLEVWKALTVTHQEEQEATLKNIAFAAGGAIVQLERVLELTNVTSRQNILLQEDINVVKGRLAIAAIFSSVYMILSKVFMTVYMIYTSRSV